MASESLVQVNKSLAGINPHAKAKTSFGVEINSMRRPTVVVRSDILSSWLTVSDYSKSQLASELGVSRGRISQLLGAHEEPSAHLMAKLLLLTQLPFDRLFIVTTGKVANGQKAASNRHSQKSTGFVGVRV